MSMYIWPILLFILKVVNYLLFPFSIIYGFVLKFRDFFYNANILKSFSFPIPVISVGNIQVGGTGKTPHVEYILNLLSGKKKVAVLSRGYKRKNSGFYEVIATGIPSEFGDEPLQIKIKFPETKVFVCENRVVGISRILQKFPQTEVILLDDAHQHRKVKPSFSILLIDYNNMPDKDRLLPVGKLREDISGLKRADMVVLSHSPENIKNDELNQIRVRLKLTDKQYLTSSYIGYNNLIHLFSKKLLATQELMQYEVVLLTGIANSDYIKKWTNNHYKKVHFIKFSDHHTYSAPDIAHLLKLFDNIAAAKKMILTTEKDAVKLFGEQVCSNLLQPTLPIYYVPIEVRFHQTNEESFDQIIINHAGKNKTNS